MSTLTSLVFIVIVGSVALLLLLVGVVITISDLKKRHEIENQKYSSKPQLSDWHASPEGHL